MANASNDKEIMTGEQLPSKNEAPVQKSISMDEFVPELLTVSPSPHIRQTDTTRTIMIHVCVALLPAVIWGVFVFGWRALTITLLAVISSMLSEAAYELIMKKPVTVLDFSAVVTGLILALNLPVTVPLWMPVVGSVFAIVVVKQLFGGLGKNFMNPALAGRVFLFTAWASRLSASSCTQAGIKPSAFSMTVDETIINSVAGATPLADITNGNVPSVSVMNAFLGYEGGAIGEVSALLLLAGFLYLLINKVVTWHIPVSYIATVFVLCFIFPMEGMGALDFALMEIFSGGLFIGAIFMATDYVTSPITPKGCIIYGVGCGLITVFIRYFSSYPEGASFAILIMNLLVWYIDRYTKTTRFGGGKRAKKQFAEQSK